MVCPCCGCLGYRPSCLYETVLCLACGHEYSLIPRCVPEVRKMQVKDLVKDVKASELERKAEKAKKILECKMRELDRAKRVVAKLEQDLAEFKELDLEDVELCDYRY